MAPSQQSDPRVLPSKEAGLFRQLIRQYEMKQYKKGAKTADSILRSHPEHGETLAMKGLVLSFLSRKAEARDLVRLGVRHDLRSHLCWHVYGVVCRGDGEYDEAVKCYKNALRLDPSNVTVLKDLAALQVHLRDAHGLCATRQSLLELKPSQRTNWLALAVAHHLSSHHEVAASVLASYASTLELRTIEAEPYEHSEVLLYRAEILREGGRAGEALEALEAAEKQGFLRDPVGSARLRARLLRDTGAFEASREAFEKLLDLTPDDREVHDALREIVEEEIKERLGGEAGDDPSDADASFSSALETRLTALYRLLQERHPRSLAVRRVPLDFASGQAFEGLAEDYLSRGLARGQPSLFSDLRPLLADAAKAASLLRLSARLEEDLLRAPDARAAEASFEAGEAPSWVWARFFRAQHLAHGGSVEDALRLLGECVAAAPRVVELRLARAATLAQAGDLAGAAAEADGARLLDPSDRFVNGVAVRALFAAGRAAEAERTAALFTRDGEQTNNLFDMQALWYELAAGQAYAGAGDLGRALRCFRKVDAHFDEFVEDQFDFHTYCVRKQTLRAYLDLLRLEDDMYSQPDYARGVCGALRVYVRLHRQREKQRADEQAAAAKRTPEEQKRAEQKARKQERKAAQAAPEPQTSGSGKKGTAKDADPQGLLLLALPDPLGECAKLLVRLERHAGRSPEVLDLAVQVHLLRRRPWMALRAARALCRLEGGDSPAALRAVAAVCAVAERKEESAASPAIPAPALFRSHCTALLDGAADLAAHLAAWRARAGASLPGRAALVEAAALAGLDARAAAPELVSAGLGAGDTHEQAVAAARALETGAPEAEDLRRAWGELAAERFPRSSVFGGSRAWRAEDEAAAAVDKLKV